MSSNTQPEDNGGTPPPAPNNTASETTLLTPTSTYFADEKIQIPEIESVRLSQFFFNILQLNFSQVSVSGNYGHLQGLGFSCR